MTEIEHLAAIAWKELSRKPSILDAVTGRSNLPPGVALDMVQDAGCERGEAARAIFNAAADELVRAKYREIADAAGQDAIDMSDAILAIRSGMFAHARTNIDMLDRRNYQIQMDRQFYPMQTSREEASRAFYFCDWAKKAYVTLEWCEKVAAAI
jgi:hypothetical protein